MSNLTSKLKQMCRVHKPGVPWGPASTPRLGPSRQHVTHGPAQESKQQARRAVQSLTERSGRGGIVPACRLRPTSLTRALTLVSSPPSDGLSDRKAWPNTTSGSDPHLRLWMRQTPAHCSSPTGAIRADWDEPTGDAHSVRTRNRWRK